MKQFLIFTCSALMISSIVVADDTNTACADGSGTIVIGAVTGHRYCKSNRSMNWWNAFSWCDGQKKQLVSLDDCAYSSQTGYGVCPELKVGIQQHIRTQTPYSNSASYTVYLENGTIGHGHSYSYGDGIFGFALCK